MVLDPTLAGPLGLVTEVSLLKVCAGHSLFYSCPLSDGCGKHHGVDKMFWLEAGPLSATSTNIVYLCRPLIKWIKIIAG